MMVMIYLSIISSNIFFMVISPCKWLRTH